MFFESSKPVTGSDFFNRTKELAELVNTVELLKKGSTKYLALIRIATLDEATEKLLELRANHSFASLKDKLSDTLFSSIIDFPEKLAQETDIYFVSIIDEFQELTDLSRFKHIKENIGDIFAFLRARWQRHLRVNYIVAGSKLTMMKEIITRERAPFFQHFKIIEIGNFDFPDAKQMLTALSEKAGNPIPQKFPLSFQKFCGEFNF